jgi:hypothetical protein
VYGRVGFSASRRTCEIKFLNSVRSRLQNGSCDYVPDILLDAGGLERDPPPAEELLVARDLVFVTSLGDGGATLVQNHVDQRFTMDHAGEKLPEFKIRIRQGVADKDEASCLHQFDTGILPDELHLEVAQVLQEGGHDERAVEPVLMAALLAVTAESVADLIKYLLFVAELDESLWQLGHCSQFIEPWSFRSSTLYPRQPRLQSPERMRELPCASELI